MRHYRLALFIIIALLCFSFCAEAQILTNLAGQYHAASAGWMTAGLVYAKRLFFLLASIEIAVTSIYLLFQKDGPAEFFSSLLIKVLGLLFAWVLLQEAPTWIPSIINSFTQAGSAIGHTATLDPSSVIDQGLMVANTALGGINNASIFSAFLLIVVAGLSALVIVIAYTVIAAQLLITLVESYIVIGGGVLMLGFAGSRWTTVFTERYFSYLVSVGIKLFVLFLIIGLGTGLGSQFATLLTQAAASGPPVAGAYLEIMSGALVFMILSWHVPSLAASMMTGSPSLTAGTSASTAMLTAAAAMTAVNKTLAAISSNKPTASTALMEATKAGMGEIKRSPELPTIQPRQGGLNAVTPPASPSTKRGFDLPFAAPPATKLNAITPRGDAKAASPPPAQAARAAGDTFKAPPLPNDQAHGNITIRFKED